ncbi:23S rRNA (uridine(2552)-2'-O)-methyltransferase [Halobacteria archaeon HArc-gm2]|nr:23S rRNA (uridine(2552)-2'-O)-methyltransferase [Halobacteria archaeon HArc-gm2]
MSGKDDYYNRAKQEGYRARSAYKLEQLDETAGLLGEGGTVVDLGAAPGGWLQVAAERVGDGGTVVGVDRQRIDELDDDHGAAIEYVRGDMTDADTVDEVIDIVGEADTVISDMAPNMSGDYDLDHARSVHLASQAFDVALHVLGSGGDFAAKVFDGRDLDDLKERVEGEFEYVREVRPDASRDASSELYLVGKGFLTAPVREGDELEVTIEDVGSEGDGIAKVEGYTLFVGGTEAGETLTVRVDDVKPNFGFAQPLDGY